MLELLLELVARAWNSGVDAVADRHENYGDHRSDKLAAVEPEGKACDRDDEALEYYQRENESFA